MEGVRQMGGRRVHGFLGCCNFYETTAFASFRGEKHDWKRIKAIIRGRSILDGDGKGDG